MADAKISALTSATLPLAGTEVVPLVQSGTTKKVAVDDLTVKNVRSNSSTGLMQITGPAAGQTRVMTTPDANFTAARTDAAQTFTGSQKLSDGFYTNNGNTGSIPHNTATTIFALSGGGLYQVTAFLRAGEGAPGAYSSFATVAFDGTAARIVANDASLMTITLSGNNVQVTQLSSAPQPDGVAWSFSRLSYS